MRHRLSMLAFALSTAVAAPYAVAADDIVKFNGAFGVHPVAGNVTITALPGSTTPNTVRGVAPGGRPWGILSFKASIRADGNIRNIRAKGEGLVLVGGDNAGSRGGIRQVVLTLYCGAGNVGFNSPAADLSVGGDFEINGPLDAMPPNPCGDATTPPLLLIRNFANGAPGAWFAVGVVDD